MASIKAETCSRSLVEAIEKRRVVRLNLGKSEGMNDSKRGLAVVVEGLGSSDTRIDNVLGFWVMA